MSGEGTQHPAVSGSIPAGWYPDPAGGAGKRWWDGTVWTANLQEPEARPMAPTFGNYVPADQRAFTPPPTAEIGTAYTRASWWIAGSPIWVVVPQVIVIETFDSLAPLPRPTLVLAIVLFTGLAWIILGLLAFADRRMLISGGNNSAASGWWILLTSLGYLIARARQVGLYATGGWASVIWWCLAAILTPGISVLAIFGVYGLVAN
jgi:Protein of unknown function (DUF2510)